MDYSFSTLIMKRNLEKLMLISESLSTVNRFSELLNVIFNNLKELLNAEASSLVLVNKVGDKIHHEVYDSAENKESMTTKDILWQPLKIDEKIIGTVEIINPLNKDKFDEDDKYILSFISPQIAIAISNTKKLDKVLNETSTERFGFKDKSSFVTKNKRMIEILDLVKKIAKTDISVLITGESGVGKELIAKTIFDNSNRNNKGKLIEVNCAAIPETLFESELFGHEKGSFTGAINSKKGKFELANNGILFLDEIGDMPLNSQSKLLRAIEEQKIERIGASKNIKINTRIISATNKELLAEIEEDNFRQDLYYRINEININIPPLRERKDDISILIEHFISVFNRMFKKDVKGISNVALKYLMSYDWPGNVRQLQNTIKSAVVLAEKELIWLEHLPIEMKFNKSVVKKEQVKEQQITNHSKTETRSVSCESIQVCSLKAMEKIHIENVLKHTKWNKSKAARILEISRPRLDRKIESYGLVKNIY